MVKYGGNAIVEWMTVICDLAWRQEVPDGEERQLMCHFTRGKEIRMKATFR